MIRMHRYPDGRMGLAAFCDTCGKQITEHGFVVWTSAVREWRVIHQARCDSRRFEFSMPLDVEILHLANSAGIDLAETLKDAAES